MRRVVIELNNVWFSYDSRSPVLRGVSFEVGGGERISIMGPSGSGKTTLLKIIAGLLKPARGSVRVLDGNWRPGDIGYIPQDLGLVENLTVLQNVLLGAIPRVGRVDSVLGFFPRSIVDDAMEVLELVGIRELSNRKAWELSGGERQRVAIARAMLQRPKILLADEMVSDLDYIKAREIMRTLSDVSSRRGITLVMVHHDLDIVRYYSDTTLLMRDGVIVRRTRSVTLNPSELREVFARGGP